ncbi:MAG TPA: phosphotransferase [Bacilli bacterium]|nr:MAG: Phosphotransferase enzyme family protein [Tenericutes bacterium ADurb.BinA124]HPX83987.1 phosphotransferase [Bacilli bacterium]
MINKETIKKVLNNNNINKIKLLNQGWSNDCKYYIEDIQQQKFILRISDISLYDTKLAQYNYLKEINKLNINAPVPIEFGTFDNQVYMLLSWVHGDDALEVIPTLDEKSQYELGIKAGLMLKQIHSIPVASNQIWYEVFKNKIPQKIKKAKAALIQHQHLDTFIDYVLNNMEIIKNNPMKLTHGDYHLGNMVISKDLKLGIIDFDKVAIADPIDDFKPFAWNVRKSPVFATGLIDGYYSGKPQESFFKALTLYAAESCIANVAWAISFGEEEIKIASEVSDQTYEWYKGFSLIVPTWYEKNLKNKFKTLFTNNKTRIILSLKQEYLDRIVEGKKQFEYRFSIPIEDLEAYLYIPTPHKKIAGTLELKNTRWMDKKEVSTFYQKVGDGEYETMFAWIGERKGCYVSKIDSVTLFKQAISFKYLKDNFNFTAPQQWLYLHKNKKLEEYLSEVKYLSTKE